jgi:hypothetical protein
MLLMFDLAWCVVAELHGDAELRVLCGQLHGTVVVVVDKAIVGAVIISIVVVVDRSIERIVDSAIVGAVIIIIVVCVDQRRADCRTIVRVIWRSFVDRVCVHSWQCGWLRHVECVRQCAHRRDDDRLAAVCGVRLLSVRVRWPVLRVVRVVPERRVRHERDGERELHAEQLRRGVQQHGLAVGLGCGGRDLVGSVSERVELAAVPAAERVIGEQVRLPGVGREDVDNGGEPGAREPIDGPGGGRWLEYWRGSGRRAAV